MKNSFRALIAAALVTAFIITRAVAQENAPATNAAAPPAIAIPGAVAEPTTNTARPKAPKKTAAKPAAKTASKKTEARPQAEPEPVLNPEPGVAKQNNVNVRGQASINSEVITHLQKNQPVTILEEKTLKNSKQDEPARWYRIVLPTNVSVWVHSTYIDSATKTVKPKRLNLRGGPGENYSVVGNLEKGATVNQIDSKGDWLKIEPPTNSFGFVAAHLVDRSPAALVSTAPRTPEVAVAPTAPPVTTPPPVVAEVTPTTPPVAPAAPLVPAPSEPVTATPPPATITPAPAEALPDGPIEKVKKVVSREGLLKGSASIQAPTYFELRSLDTGKTINYVFSPSTNLMLKEFKGKRIIVSGEELLDERWQNTPVIIVDSLETVP